MKPNGAPDATAGLDSAASTVQRLAVLLAAGVTPASAWGYLAEGARDGPDAGRDAPPVARREGTSVLERVVAAMPTAGTISGAILQAVEDPTSSSEAGIWRGLAAAWQVATDAGAPLAATLNDLASSLRDLAQTGREVQVALAEPVATARMVMVLPIIGVFFGLTLGFDTLGTLFTTVPGVACLVLGSTLMLAARAWNQRLVRTAQPKDVTPGLTLDLVAIAVSGGASIDRARTSVSDALAKCGIAADGDESVVDGVLDLSQRAGVPAAMLLRTEAEQARRLARSDGARRAAALSVKLMLPLGICVLPAFMLLGVAPLLIAVISSTVSAL